MKSTLIAGWSAWGLLCAGILAGLLNADEPAPQVKLTTGTWQQVQERVAALKGQVVVIDAWSTSCPPCLKEFPKFVALHKQHAKRGLKCISLNCDYDGSASTPPEKHREEVLQYLTRQGATCENYLCRDAHEKWLEKVDLGSLPAVFVYGRDGKLAKRFDSDSLKPGEKEFTYADVTKLVEQLLNAPASVPSDKAVSPPR